MHTLTGDRMRWGHAALLTGLALGAAFVSGRRTHRAAPAPVSLMSMASRMPPEPVPGSRYLHLWPGLLSPDGKWELNWDMGCDSECTVIAHDRSRTITRKLRGERFRFIAPSNKIWLPDSRSWVGLLDGAKSLYAVVQSLDATGAVHEIPLGYPKGTIDWPDLMASELLGFIGTDRVLARPGGPDELDRQHEVRRVHFYDFSLGSAGGSVHQYVVALPQGVECGDVALSPRGDRLAWIRYHGAQCQNTSTAANMLELDVSRTDGSAMRTIGTLPTEPGEGQYQHRRLAWLPDGAHLSLNHGGARWSVPVGL